MLKDQDFLHGAAFLKLINYGIPVIITHFSSIHASIYSVETQTAKAAILFKVSTKPTSAWPFNFTCQEVSAIKVLHEQYPQQSLFISFICYKDGICCLPEQLLLNLLICYNLEGHRISVARKPRGSYRISGTGRVSLNQTIPQSDFPRVIFQS